MLQIFITDITDADHLVQKAACFLDKQEQQRLLQIKAKSRLQQFLFGRVLLKTCLKKYFNVSSDQCAIGIAEDGKPYLAPNEDSVPINFSIAHSGCWIACAISTIGAVGIDIEQKKARALMETMATRVLAPNERKMFAGLTSSEKLEFFYQRWVLKESYYKAQGQESMAFNKLDFESLGDRQFKLLGVSDGSWQFFGFNVAKDVLGALTTYRESRAERLPDLLSPSGRGDGDEGNEHGVPTSSLQGDLNRHDRSDFSPAVFPGIVCLQLKEILN